MIKILVINNNCCKCKRYQKRMKNNQINKLKTQIKDKLCYNNNNMIIKKQKKNTEKQPNKQ